MADDKLNERAEDTKASIRAILNQVAAEKPLNVMDVASIDIEMATESLATYTNELVMGALEEAAKACERGNTGAMFETSIRASFARIIRALASLRTPQAEGGR